MDDQISGKAEKLAYIEVSTLQGTEECLWKTFTIEQSPLGEQRSIANAMFEDILALEDFFANAMWPRCVVEKLRCCCCCLHHLALQRDFRICTCALNCCTIHK